MYEIVQYIKVAIQRQVSREGLVLPLSVMKLVVECAEVVRCFSGLWNASGGARLVKFSAWLVHVDWI